MNVELIAQMFFVLAIAPGLVGGLIHIAIKVKAGQCLRSF